LSHQSININQLPCDPGPAAWNELLSADTPRASLQTKLKADWLIVGAGFTGLACARRLAQLHSGDRIVVVDASAIAHGPAGRNSGFMIDVPHDLTTADYAGFAEKDLRDIRLNRAGIRYALDAKASYKMPDEAARQSGKINGAITRRGIQHNEGYARYLDSLSEPYKLLDAEQMQRLTGIHCYQQGLYTSGTVMLQPAMYIRALARGIEDDGVTLYENSPVLKLRKQGSGWLASTPGGEIEAAKAILTVNGHLESFGFAKRQLMHVFTYGSMTRALTESEISTLGGSADWSITPADTLGTTVRRISGTGGHRIVVRNRATYDPSLKVKSNRLQNIAHDHNRSYRFRFPMLRDVEMEYCWGGRLCLSRNNVSVFGELDRHLYAACCQNGLGTAKGTISGKLVAELACGETSDLLNDQLADASPTRLPPEPLASIGAKAVLRWGEWRAGHEL